MNWRRYAPGALALLILVVGGIGYAIVIPQTKIERSRLAELVAVTPPSLFTAKPASAGQVQASSSPFTLDKTYAKQAPNATGSYSVEWSGHVSSEDSASLFASFVPSSTDARALHAAAVKQYLGKSSLKNSDYTYTGALTGLSIPSAAGVVFSSTASKGSGTVVLVFGVGRVEILAFVAMTGPLATTEATARTLAVSEYHLLSRIEPAFTLTHDEIPLTASIIYLAVVVVLAASVVLAPPLAAASRARRERARQDALRRQYSSRGRKVVKRYSSKPRIR